jgi:uncharacterized repeat protein (TIGR01451 family)
LGQQATISNMTGASRPLLHAHRHSGQFARIIAGVLALAALYTPLPGIASSTADGDLSVTKTSNAPNGYASPGLDLEYTISVQNLGTSSVSSVRVTETVPTNATFLDNRSPFDPIVWRLPSGSACPNGASAGTVCVASIAGSMTGGQVSIIPFSIRIATNAPGNSTITNTVSASHSGTDPVLSNNTFDLVTPVDPRIASGRLTAALAVDANSNGRADPNDEIAYTLVVSNSGPITLAPLIIDAPFFNSLTPPPRAASVLTSSVTSSAGTISMQGSGFRVTVNSAAPNATYTIGFRERVNALVPGFVVSATHQARFSTNLPGLNGVIVGYSNQTGIEFDPRLDLALRNSVKLADPFNGETQFELRYGNLGAVTANNVVLSAQIPEHAEFVAAGSSEGWICDTGACTYAAGVITGTQSETGYFGVLTYTLRPLTSLPTTQTTLTTTTSIAGNGVDVFPTNNSATLVAPFGPRATYKITQRTAFALDARNDNKLELGDAITYTIILTNTSATRAAGNLRLLETFPVPGFGQDSYVDVEPVSLVTSKGSASFDGSAVVVDINILNPGESVTIIFRAVLSALPPATTNGINTFVSVSDSFNSAARTPVNRVRVFYARELISSLTATAPRELGVVEVGDRITFTTHFTNTGIETLTGWVMRGGEGAPGSGADYGCLAIDSGSVAASRGTVTQVTNGYGDVGFSLALDPMPVGASGRITYTARVKNAPPCLGSRVFNLVSTYESTSGALHNRTLPSAAILRGPYTPVGVIRAKPARGVVDVIPGEALDMSITVINAGTQPLINTRLINDDYSCYIVTPGTPRVTSGGGGAVTLGTQSPPSLSARWPTLEPGMAFTVTFKAVVDTDPGCSAIESTGAIYDEASGGPRNQTLPFRMPIVERHSITGGAIYMPHVQRG